MRKAPWLVIDGRKNSRKVGGFSLVEVAVALAIVVILATIAMGSFRSFQISGNRTASLNQLRQIGVAAFSYAAENDQSLPRRVTEPENGAPGKWPRLLADFVDDTSVYAAPGDRRNFLVENRNPLANRLNFTSYVMNGYNDLGTLEDESVSVRLARIERPSNVILLGIARSGNRDFYMDVLEGDHLEVLDLEFYGAGSNYLFADGSSRFLDGDSYDHELWLVDKDFPLP